MMSLANEDMKREISQLRKQLSTILKSKGSNVTIEKKYDKRGNKVSMYEAVKKVDKETVTKETIAVFTRDHITSLQSGNFEDICEINNVLIFEA